MFEPSAHIVSLLNAIALRDSAATGMRAMTQRASEFTSAAQAKLTGVALDPNGRELADRLLDAYWRDEQRRADLMTSADINGEVIIGSGVHAAIYAAIRVLRGYPKPLVLERDERVGGTFAMTARPTFWLNSRNRRGAGGMAGDQGASLNYLPGAPIQASNVSMAEYQPNTDLAFVVRLTLAQYADVVPGADVRSVADYYGDRVRIETGDGPSLAAGRVIDARGLGDPADEGVADGVTILTFPQFMKRMSGMWPLRGVGRVAVIGGGDSAKCAVETCLGIAPPAFMAAVALDQVDRVDWYAQDLPTTCEEWQEDIRGRYQAIGRYLRPDRFGVQRLNLVTRRAMPVALPGAGLVDGRTYDLVVVCTGNRETNIEGLDFGLFSDVAVGGSIVARRHGDLPAWRVGPHARLEFTDQERADGVADIEANAVSVFRTAPKTAALAATLPAVKLD
ncbi:hypothetical protein Ais01nite_73850 [Asanoa ishikariensis]|uniref:Pyridine nucleotide-disulphide oxidoreductase n=1 Tax=Asanoa ishikariensis TaxID=137265 RepID=A0A1H3URL6_9ACTN|nr:hypothetical protein [Asanoa ishikariensis]GIF69350.1 hypothetical protein Ais01nite_73850 [Asanoa ishikariensis]SDZ65034.1 hypothetical protein SAMN05421684_7909 [Asanoa ishikariensis]